MIVIGGESGEPLKAQQSMGILGMEYWIGLGILGILPILVWLH